jgi:hypothetical protein
MAAAVCAAEMAFRCSMAVQHARSADRQQHPVADRARAVALRDDALGADLAHCLEQLPAKADNVVDHDDPFTARVTDNVAQQCLAVLDCAGAEVMAVEMQEVEGEIRELLGTAPARRLGQQVDMGDAARRAPRPRRRGPARATRLRPACRTARERARCGRDRCD